MKNNNALILLIFSLFLIISLPVVSANIIDDIVGFFKGDKQIQEASISIETGSVKNNILKYENEEAEDWNIKKENGEVCLYEKDEKKAKVKEFKDDKGTLIEADKVEKYTDKDGKQKDKYCFSSKDYVKIGTNTIIITNEPTQYVNFTTEDGTTSRAEIQKFVAGTWDNNVNNITIFETDIGKGFNAYDSSGDNEVWDLYRYNFSTDNGIYKEINKKYYLVGEEKAYHLDLSDTCSKYNFTSGNQANCEYDLLGGGKQLLVQFNSPKEIDPQYIEANLSGDNYKNDTIFQPSVPAFKLETENLRIFVTNATTDGDIGGLSGADAFCQSDSNNPDPTKTWKAVLGTDERKIGGTDWVFEANRNYYRNDSTTLITTMDNDGRPSFNLDNSINPSGSSDDVIGGAINSDYFDASHNCNNWTSSSSGNPYFSGTSSAVSDSAFFSNELACNTVKQIYCVEQITDQYLDSGEVYSNITLLDDTYNKVNATFGNYTTPDSTDINFQVGTWDKSDNYSTDYYKTEDDIVAFFPLDSENLNDVYGGFNLTDSFSVQNLSGEYFGDSLYFNGSGAGFDKPRQTYDFNPNYASTNFGVCVYANFTDVSSGDLIAHKEGSVDQGWTFGVDTNKRLNYQLTNSSGDTLNGLANPSSYEDPTNKWTSYCFSFTEDTLVEGWVGKEKVTIYSDNDNLALKGFTGGVIGTSMFSIGGKVASNDYVFTPWNGGIDHIIIFNKSLTQEDVDKYNDFAYLNWTYTSLAKSFSEQDIDDDSTHAGIRAILESNANNSATPTWNGTYELNFYSDIPPPPANVTLENATEFPTDPATYSPSQIYNFTIDAYGGTIDEVFIEWQGTNISANLVSGNTYFRNFNGLDAGFYEYIWWANNSDGNSASLTGNYTINEATSEVFLFINGSRSDNTTFQNISLPINVTLLTGEFGELNLTQDGVQVNYSASENLYYTFNESVVGLYNLTAYYYSNGNYLDDIESWIINVTEAPDTQNPQINNLTEFPTDPVTYSQGNTYYFNATVTDNIELDTVQIEWEGVNYSTINIGGNVYQFNITDLGAGNYSYSWNANDTSGNYNSTATQTYTINKYPNICSLTVNNPTYPNNVTAFGSCDNPEATEQLFLNGVLVSNPFNQRLGVDSYVFVLNVSETQNYTSATDTDTSTVSKGTPSGSLDFDPSNNEPVGTETTVTGTETNIGDGDLTYQLFRDGSLVSNPDVETLSQGTYPYEFNTTGGQNWTSATLDTGTLTITGLTGEIQLFLNGTRSDLTVTNGTSVNISAVLNSGVGNIQIYVDDVLWNSGTSPISNTSVFNTAGEFVVSANYSGNANYTADSESWILTVQETGVSNCNLGYNVVIPDNLDNSPYARLCQSIPAKSNQIFEQESSSTIEIPVYENDLSRCTSCSGLITIYYSNGTPAIEDATMQKSSNRFYYNASTEILGEYSYNAYFTDGTDSGIVISSYEVTPSGKPVTITKIYAYITLLLFFFVLVLGYVYINRKLDYEKWYNSILRKYEHRNSVKAIISSIGYNFMKNSFIWYYLFGLPILLLITDLSYTFGVDSMIQLMKILLMVYWFGFLLVGAFFFGYLQEWIVRMIDEIKSIDYGVNGI